MKKISVLIFAVLVSAFLVSCAASPEDAYVAGYGWKTFDEAVRDHYKDFDGDVSFDWEEDWDAEGAPDLRRVDPNSSPARFSITVTEDEAETEIVIFFSFDKESNELIARGVWMHDGKVSKSFAGGYADNLFEEIYK